MDKIAQSRIYKNNTRIISCNAKNRNIRKRHQVKRKKASQMNGYQENIQEKKYK